VAIQTAFKLITPVDPGPVTREMLDVMRSIIGEVTGTPPGYCRHMDIIRYDTFKNADVRRQRALLQVPANSTYGSPTPSPSIVGGDFHVNLTDANASVSVEWHTTFIEVASLSAVGYETADLFAAAFASDLASPDFTNKLLEVAGIDCLVWDVTASQLTASPSALPTTATPLPSSAPSPAPPPKKADGSDPSSASSSVLLLGFILAGAAFVLLGLGGWRVISRRRKHALALKDTSAYNGQDPGLELSGLEPETEASLEAVMMGQHLDVDARATYLKRVQSAQAMAKGNKKEGAPQFFNNPMMNNSSQGGAPDKSVEEGNGGAGSKMSERLAAQNLYNKGSLARTAASSKQLKADAIAKADAAAKASSFNSYGTSIGGGGGGYEKRRTSVQAMYGADGRELSGFDDMVASSGAVGGTAREEAQRRYQEKMKSFKMAAAEPPSDKMGALSLGEKLEAQDAALKRAAKPAGFGEIDEEDATATNVFDIDAVLGDDDNEDDKDASLKKMAMGASYGNDEASDKNQAEDAARADSKFLQKLKARAEAGDAAALAKLRDLGHAPPLPPPAPTPALRAPSGSRVPGDTESRPYGTETDL